MTQNQDSILITLSQKTIKDRRGGFKKILEEWRSADGEQSTWWYKCGTAPKDPENVNWVYWVVKGRIRYRARLLDVVKDREIQFTNQSKPMFAKRWLVLFDFEQIPRRLQINRKGFQGFRYFDSDSLPINI